MSARRAELTGHLYTHVEATRRSFKVGAASFMGKPCYYCGIPATDVDHVPPISMADALVTTDAINASLLVTVDACKDCNSHLGAKPIMTPEERRREVRDHLAAQISKHRDVEWSVAEIRELGPNMKREVRAFWTWLKAMRARLAWASAEAPLSVRDDQIELTNGGQLRRAMAAAAASAEKEAAPAAEEVEYGFSQIAGDCDMADDLVARRVGAGGGRGPDGDGARRHAPVTPPGHAPVTPGEADGAGAAAPLAVAVASPVVDVGPVLRAAAPLAGRSGAGGGGSCDGAGAGGDPPCGRCGAPRSGAARMGADPRQLSLFPAESPPDVDRARGRDDAMGASAERAEDDPSAPAERVPDGSGHPRGQDADQASGVPSAPPSDLWIGAHAPEVMADDDRDVAQPKGASVRGRGDLGQREAEGLAAARAASPPCRRGDTGQRDTGPRRAPETETARPALVASRSGAAGDPGDDGAPVDRPVPGRDVSYAGGASAARPPRAKAPRKAPAKKNAKGGAYASGGPGKGARAGAGAGGDPRARDGAIAGSAGGEPLRDESDPWGLNPEPAPSPAAKKPAKPKVSKATPHGIEWAALIERYHVAYERVRGVRPTFDGADARAMQRLLEKVSTAEVKDYTRAGRVIDNAFADPWWGPKVTIREIASNPARFDRTTPARRHGAHFQKPPMNPDGTIRGPKPVDIFEDV